MHNHEWVEHIVDMHAVAYSSNAETNSSTIEQNNVHIQVDPNHDTYIQTCQCVTLLHKLTKSFQYQSTP